jgi:hypothetical protein
MLDSYPVVEIRSGISGFLKIPGRILKNLLGEFQGFVFKNFLKTIYTQGGQKSKAR